MSDRGLRGTVRCLPASLLNPDIAAEHRPRLLDVAYSICGSRTLAEDLVQETYARVLAKPRPLTEGADFPYLVRALRNVAKDHWRSEQRRPQVIGDLDPEDPSLRHDREPQHEVMAQEVYEHVERAPARVPQRRQGRRHASASATRRPPARCGSRRAP